MNEKQIFIERLEDLHDAKGGTFEMVTSWEFSQIKTIAIRKMTKSKVDEILHQFFNKK